MEKDKVQAMTLQIDRDTVEYIDLQMIIHEKVTEFLGGKQNLPLGDNCYDPGTTLPGSSLFEERYGEHPRGQKKRSYPYHT